LSHRVQDSIFAANLGQAVFLMSSNTFWFSRGASFMLWVGAMALFSSCSTEQNDGNGEVESNQNGDGGGGATGCKTVSDGAIVRVGNLNINMSVPDVEPKGDLLLLPAWDDSEGGWCTRSRICAKALKQGYRIVMPEMGKSMYCMEVYPETRPDWKTAPTFPFLKDSILPWLQEQYCLFTPDGNNFVLGVGAGGRGALRLLEEMPDLFVAGAAMSGDYNPSLFPKDNLYRGFLGSSDQFQDRWSITENICHKASEIKTPLFLAHGTEDQYVRSEQTDVLYAEIQKSNPELTVKAVLEPDFGHGFSFWNTQVNDIFSFFSSYSTQHAEAP